MGIIKKLASCVWGKKSNVADDQQAKTELLRRCYFEVMEERRVLSANPVIAGVTYLEGDAGQDTHPDHFEVSFEGGGETTQLTQFTINGDQDQSGDLSDGDMFFDVAAGGPGTGGYHNFQFDAANSVGITEDDILGFSVSEDGLVLSVQLKNLDAGDKFAFTIDVDEVERFKTDKIASGVEFEGTFFNASFVDDNYTFVDKTVAIDAELIEGQIQPQSEGIFYDEYDQLFTEGERLAGNSIDLNRDNALGQSDRSAGAIDAYDLVEKPIAISGTVYHDQDTDCVHDDTESGIAGVEVTLQRFNDATGEYENVASTTTDADGNYEFGFDLDLKPGTFRLIETQPDGYLNVGAVAGKVEGTTTGDVENNANGEPNVIGNITIAKGGTVGTDYDFCEVRPASLEGNVWHDANNDGTFDSDEQGIANVLIRVTRIGAKDGVNTDVFADTPTIFVKTDENGHYSVDALPPGIYEITEVNEYPADANDPLAPYIDGKDSLGNIAGTTVGTKSNDRFNQVVLCAEEHGVEYNFGEVKPAEIHGTVWHDRNNDGVLDDAEDRIAGVTIQLFDADGNLVDEMQTNAAGEYWFMDLYPGEYHVQELQPDAYVDGKDSLGVVTDLNGDTESRGLMTNDRFDQITLAAGDKGTTYDFGEIKLASISGTVRGDVDGNCVYDPSVGDELLEGVELTLLDEDGNEIARTFTDSEGNYTFDGLMPGTYSVREVTPEGYLNGETIVGTIDGNTTGTQGDDLITSITLVSGDQGVHYDFCEHVPAELHGVVYHDLNNNGVLDEGEEGIAGVLMTLTDVDGNVIAQEYTMDNGHYWFTGLEAGEYCVHEAQPTDYVDGKDAVGTVDGTGVGVKENDELCQITLQGGDKGVNYNFGEIKLAEISGQVHVDTDGNCVFDANNSEDRLLANVTLELLDQNGVVIATTETNELGQYRFQNLLPGEYSIRQVQPDEFFSLGESVGDGGGVESENLLSGIVITSGQKLTQYNFCEEEAAEIHGRVWEDGPAFETVDGALPANYRSQRDGVYQEGVDTPLAGVRMYLYYYIDPANGEVSPRPVTLGDVQASHYTHMGTTDPDAPVWTETMDNGEYWFQGLRAGNYIVLETQPEGLFDSNDTPGTTTGFTYNSFGEAATAEASVIRTFSSNQIMDSVVNIRVNSGGISTANNFSEVRVNALTVPPSNPPVIPPLNPPPITPLGHPTPPSVGIAGYPGLYGSEPSAFTQFIGTSRGASFQTGTAAPADTPYTWHLSVINGGLPRGEGEGDASESIWQQAGFISNTDWNRYDMTEAVWTFAQTDQDHDTIVKVKQGYRFGTIDGIPLAGDFDGDGIDEVAVYKDGYWMIDLNRNGIWEETDLLARLGDAEDRPVVGDWDGDGKDDIGIYGPMWQHDPEAIERDPGLPNPDNQPFTKPKNVPPVDADAARGARIMKLTSYGKQRADVVDHVFGVDDEEIIPVTGDWNGNGIRSIGTFKNGVWHLDINGDGRFDHNDVTARFGRAGDVPIVGDFDGDGIEEIAVYRSGVWFIDSNGNRELDATDKTFEMGGAEDQPVAGDWDGDGTDEPGLYTQQQTPQF